MKPITFKTDGSPRRGFSLEAGEHTTRVLVNEVGPARLVDVPNDQIDSGNGFPCDKKKPAPAPVTDQAATPPASSQPASPSAGVRARAKARAK